MLNHVHNNHLRNTDGGGQAMGEELKYVQMNRWGIQKGGRSGNRGYKAESNATNMKLQNKGKWQKTMFIYPHKSWRSNTITHGS